MLKTIIWDGAVICALMLGSSSTSFSQQASPTPAPTQQATIEASPLPAIIQAPKRNRLPGWTVVRIYSDAYTNVKQGVFVQQFVKYLDDRSCSTPPCYLLYNRLWDSIDSYSSSKFPDGETSYCVFGDEEMNPYRKGIFVHGDEGWVTSANLYKVFNFPFKPNGKWSWAFIDRRGASFSVSGESLGWAKPPGMEDYTWPTVHFRVHGTCMIQCTSSPDFRDEFYYAPEIGTLVWGSINGVYSSVLSKDKTREDLWLTGLQKLPPLPPPCQL